MHLSQIERENKDDTVEAHPKNHVIQRRRRC
jgi:hypothetical protein